MADPRDEEQRAIERQYAIDVITAQYAAEVRAGRQPRIEEYVRRYPQYAAELLDFAVYYHAIGIHTEALADPADTALSPAAERAQALIRERRGMAGAALRGIVARGQEVGYQPPQLAAAVNLTVALLGKLEARAIAAATIPPTLIQRLATALKVAPEAVAAFLGAPGVAGAFYYAEEPPAQQQESFLDAVQGSTLPPDGKRAWAEIVRADAGGSG